MLTVSPGSPSLIRSKSSATPPTVTLATSLPSTSVSANRPTSDFDAGLNSSAAWTAQRAHDALSDDEDESSDEGEKSVRGRPARALFAFEGKQEFRELTVKAGDSLVVIRDDVGDGWSLVKHGREVGLLPKTYYTYTSEFMRSPNSEDKRISLGSDASTPRAGSPHRKDNSHVAPTTPLIPQTTGEWLRALPSFRRSLLGEKSFNRFSSFVTSGAEDFVLNGADVDHNEAPPSQARHGRFATDMSIDAVLEAAEASKHYVDAGPTWKAKIPAFRVLVHSPTKVATGFAPAYIVYSVTSLFQHSHDNSDSDSSANYESGHSRSGSSGTIQNGSHNEPLTRVTVPRRFSHFVALHAALLRTLPGLALPPLPEKQYAGRFSHDFVEARRGELERYLVKLVRHPLVRYAEIPQAFLSCDSDAEWKNVLQTHLARKPAGASFYAQVFHPAFSIDVEDASTAGERFDAHTKAVTRGVQDLRGIFGRVREARVEMSKAERSLSYALLSLITSKPLASATPVDEDAQEEQRHQAQVHGLMNEDGAWCWRDHCEECLKLTKAMQKTADTLQIVADLYDDHARRRLLATHEALKGVAHPSAIYSAVVDTHSATLARYNNEGLPGTSDEDRAARCETVLNATMAEMDTYHAQKSGDFADLAKDHIDGEIELYEQILNRLYAARSTFDQSEYAGPRQPSMYERELANPRQGGAALTQPCPHVFDSAPMRPVTVALQDGVGLLATAAGRASVLSKLW